MRSSLIMFPASILRGGDVKGKGRAVRSLRGHSLGIKGASCQTSVRALHVARAINPERALNRALSSKAERRERDGVRPGRFILH